MYSVKSHLGSILIQNETTTRVIGGVDLDWFPDVEPVEVGPDGVETLTRVIYMCPESWKVAGVECEDADRVVEDWDVFARVSLTCSFFVKGAVRTMNATVLVFRDLTKVKLNIDVNGDYSNVKANNLSFPDVSELMEFLVNQTPHQFQPHEVDHSDLPF